MKHQDSPITIDSVTFIKEIMSKNNVPDEVRKYMSDLGKKGGRANPAGTKKRRKQAREAAAKRWAKWRKEQQMKQDEEETN